MLSCEEMDAARERLPIVYVDVVPVRVDDQGTVIAVGLLLRAGEDGQIKRALVSGRVLYHERIRAALLRHMEKDLGPLALPRIPPAPTTSAACSPDWSVCRLGRGSAGDDRHRAAEAGCPAEPRVRGQQTATEGFGEGEVGGVVGRDVLPQFPDAVEKTGDG